MTDLSRRSFLKVSAGAGGSLLIAAHSVSAQEATARDESFMPSPFLKVTPSNDITFFLNHAEMGQGVYTTLPTIFCEECGLDPFNIKIEPAPVGSAYENPLFGMQVTGGSTAIKGMYMPLRKAGAGVRKLFIEAAAKQLGKGPEELDTDDGYVIERRGSGRIPFGQLVSEASKLSIDSDPELKPENKFKWIGAPIPRMDGMEKIRGEAKFGIDSAPAGAKKAVVLRSPYPGGRLDAFDDSLAKEAPGFVGIYRISSGLAVVADRYYQARKSADLVKATWKRGPLGSMGSADLAKKFEKAMESDSHEARSDGDPDGAAKTSWKKLEAVYRTPYLAHATMEPQNCSAHLQGDRLEVWAPTQGVSLAAEIAARAAGVPKDHVSVHATFMGGGFGRRAEQDYVRDACEIAKACRLPVQVIFSREDDMTHDFYRPGSVHHVKGGLSKEGVPSFWDHHVACQSIMAQVMPKFAGAALPSWLPYQVKDMVGASGAKLMNWASADETAVEGIRDLPYNIENVGVYFHEVKVPIPVGFWRSVGHSNNAFVTECFIDELAHLAEEDPLRFRQKLLKKAPRHLAVLERAAEIAGWGAPLPAGHGRGLSVHASFSSYVAQVAEVSTADDTIRVHKVHCVIDCGRILNPDIVKAQMESSIIFGLTAALKAGITFEDGKVAQSNFHDYPVLRIDESPEIIIDFIESTSEPTGVGEPATPPVAPAVGNAIFAAAGKRLRELPFRLG